MLVLKILLLVTGGYMFVSGFFITEYMRWEDFGHMSVVGWLISLFGALMLAAVAARSSVQVCRRIVLILSVFVSVLKSVFIQDFINAFSFIKTNKSWSGIYEKEQRQINKVY